MKVVSPSDEPTSAGRGGSTFTGDVFTYPTMEYTDGASINNVCFTPGARTHWHRHENGQVLMVLAGKGLVQSEGEQVNVIRAGDTVWTPPRELHWHGATSTTYMTHRAISLGEITWESSVSDSEYRKSPSQ